MSFFVRRNSQSLLINKIQQFTSVEKYRASEYSLSLCSNSCHDALCDTPSHSLSSQVCLHLKHSSLVLHVQIFLNVGRQKSGVWPKSIVFAWPAVVTLVIEIHETHKNTSGSLVTKVRASFFMSLCVRAYTCVRVSSSNVFRSFAHTFLVDERVFERITKVIAVATERTR